MLHMHSEVGNLQDGLRHVETKFEKRETESMKKSFHQLFSSLLSWFKKELMQRNTFVLRLRRPCIPRERVDVLSGSWSWKPGSNHGAIRAAHCISTYPSQSENMRKLFAKQNNILNMQSMSRFLDCKTRDMFSCPLDTSKASMFLAIPRKQDWGTIANPHKVQQADINWPKLLGGHICTSWQLKCFCLSSTFCLSAVQQFAYFHRFSASAKLQYANSTAGYIRDISRLHSATRVNIPATPR